MAEITQEVNIEILEKLSDGTYKKKNPATKAGVVKFEDGSTVEDHKSDYVLQVPYGVATGLANTYTITLNPAPISYKEGMAVAIKINTTNTGASTININGLGAKSVRKANGNNVSAGNLKAGSIYSMRYNGTNFILQGSDSAGNATPGDVLSGKTFSNGEDTDLVGTMPSRTGHVTAQGFSQSGTTLRFRPQPGYYDGSTGNSVQRTDANFIAANIRQGVSLFGITGTLIPASDDYRGAPGPTYLSHGDMNAGYFGRYAGIFTGNQLSSAAGISIGNGLFYSSSNIEWLKFSFEGKIIFLAQKPIRYALSWNDLNNAGCVYGTKHITKDGITYKCRLLRIRDGEPDTGPGREQYLVQKVHNIAGGAWDKLTNSDLYFNQPGGTNGHFSFAQETAPNNSSHCYSYTSSSGSSTVAKNDRGAWFGWRPVLEVV